MNNKKATRKELRWAYAQMKHAIEVVADGLIDRPFNVSVFWHPDHSYDVTVWIEDSCVIFRAPLFNDTEDEE